MQSLLPVILAAALVPLQPLNPGARWNYACTGGIAAVRTMGLGIVNNVAGNLNTITLTIPGQPQVQWGELEINDSRGILLGGFVFPPTYPNVPINPPQLELPNNPVIGQTFQLGDGFGGTITVTYAGLTTVSAPNAVYTGVSVFKESDSGQPPIPFPRTRYMARGIGEVQTDFGAVSAQNLPATTCQLVSYSL